MVFWNGSTPLSSWLPDNLRQIKKQAFEEFATNTETEAIKGNVKSFYDATKRCKNKPKQMKHIKK